VAKSFFDAFLDWVKDDRYAIAEDCGHEYFDNLEAGPTPADRSSTQNHVTENSTQA